jgi:hypothetical protein
VCQWGFHWGLRSDAVQKRTTGKYSAKHPCKDVEFQLKSALTPSLRSALFLSLPSFAAGYPATRSNDRALSRGPEGRAEAPFYVETNIQQAIIHTSVVCSPGCLPLEEHLELRANFMEYGSHSPCQLDWLRLGIAQLSHAASTVRQVTLTVLACDRNPGNTLDTL